jgi:Ca2+-binding RTX toxin-like protein
MRSGMGKAPILLTAVLLALVLGGGTALAATIHCGGGNCFGTDRADTMYGTNRHDAVFAKAGGDFVSGRERGDDLNGQGGEDRVLGGPGDDWVKGGDDRDTVKGDNGNDTLTGGSGRNVIRAGDGMRDLIVCGMNSRNLIYYDPGLDRFDNCVFEKSDEQRSTDGSSATITATGPVVEAE